MDRFTCQVYTLCHGLPSDPGQDRPETAPQGATACSRQAPGMDRDGGERRTRAIYEIEADAAGELARIKEVTNHEY